MGDRLFGTVHGMFDGFSLGGLGGSVGKGSVEAKVFCHVGRLNQGRENYRSLRLGSASVLLIENEFLLILLTPR